MIKQTHCAADGPVVSRSNHRVLGLFQWLAPSLILALLPKCPACVAGYVALWTGIGLSLSVASGVRHSLLVVCVGMLLFLIGRQLRRLVLRRNTTESL